MGHKPASLKQSAGLRVESPRDLEDLVERDVEIVALDGNVELHIASSNGERWSFGPVALIVRGLAVLGGLGEARWLCCRVDLDLVCADESTGVALTTTEAGPVELTRLPLRT
jgi:hypothetical protein